MYNIQTKIPLQQKFNNQLKITSPSDKTKIISKKINKQQQKKQMTSKQKYYSTVNTCTRKPSPAQICSYVVVSAQTIIFYLIIRPNLVSQQASIILTVLFSLTLAILIISSFVCSFVDPSDSVMMEYKKQNGKKIQKPNTQLLYCEACLSYVTLNARHCKQCDRCVQNFDHHCMWINNCVGSKNYRIFMAMIVSTCINLLLYIVSIIVISVQKKWTSFMGYMIAGWVVVVIVGVLWILLFNLNILHVYLICKGYTTYQFIMVRRQEEKKRELERAEESARIRQQKLKNVIQKSRKKVFQSYNVQKKDSDQQLDNYVTKVVHNQSNVLSGHEQTGTKVKINPKFGQISELEATGHLIKNKINNQNGKVNIFQSEFVQNQLNNNINQKSSVQSQNINGNPNQIINQLQIQRKNLEDFVQSSSQNETQSIKISKFFTRNKSLSLLISSQVAKKPHNISLVDGQFKKDISKNHSSVNNPPKRIRQNKKMTTIRAKNYRQNK